jgi:hypothetical protein
MHPLSPVLGFAYLQFATRVYHLFFDSGLPPTIYVGRCAFYPYSVFYAPVTLFGSVHRYLLLGLRILHLPSGYTYLQFAARNYHLFLIWDYHPPLIRVYAPVILSRVYAFIILYLDLRTIVFILVYAPIILYLGLRTRYFLFFGLCIWHLDSGSTYPQFAVWVLLPSFYRGLPLAVYMSTTFIWAYAPIIFHLGLCIHYLLFGFFIDLVLLFWGYALHIFHWGLCTLDVPFVLHTLSFILFHLPPAICHLLFIWDYHLLLLGYTPVILYLDLRNPELFWLCAIILVEFTHFCVLIRIYVPSFHGWVCTSTTFIQFRAPTTSYPFSRTHDSSEYALTTTLILV